MIMCAISSSLNRRSFLVSSAAVSDAVYGAMVEIANVPLHDKFEIITRHADDEIIYPDEGYLGIEYSRDLIIIQITWVGGRAIDMKKKFYRRIADEIHEKGKVRKEDIWINLVGSAREDWSFGNGGMDEARGKAERAAFWKTAWLNRQA